MDEQNVNEQVAIDHSTSSALRDEFRNTKKAKLENKKEHEEVRLRYYGTAQDILLMVGYVTALAFWIMAKRIDPFMFGYPPDKPPVLAWLSIVRVEVAFIAIWAVPVIWLWNRRRLIKESIRDIENNIELRTLAGDTINLHKDRRVEIEKTRQQLYRLVRVGDRFSKSRDQLDSAVKLLAQAEHTEAADAREPLNAAEQKQPGLKRDSELPASKAQVLEAEKLLFEVKAELAQDAHSKDERSSINWWAFIIFVAHLVVFVSVIIAMHVINRSESRQTASAEPAAPVKTDSASNPQSKPTSAAAVLGSSPSANSAEQKMSAPAETGSTTGAPGSAGTQTSVTEKADAVVPVLQIPIYVLLYSWIGSLLAMLWRVLRGGKRQLDSNRELSWFLARPVMGVGMGIVTYLILIIALSSTTATTVDETPKFKPELIYLASLLVALTDGPWVSLVRWGLSRIPGAQKKKRRDLQENTTSEQPGSSQPADAASSVKGKVDSGGASSPADKPDEPDSKPPKSPGNGTPNS